MCSLSIARRKLARRFPAYKAVSLRAGLVGRPWWLLVIGLFSWMFYDACFELVAYLQVGEQQTKPLAEAFRAMAFLYEFSAGLAQRALLRKITG